MRLRRPTASQIVLGLLCLMYLITYMDRVNAGTAANAIVTLTKRTRRASAHAGPRASNAHSRVAPVIGRPKAAFRDGVITLAPVSAPTDRDACRRAG